MFVVVAAGLQEINAADATTAPNGLMKLLAVKVTEKSMSVQSLLPSQEGHYPAQSIMVFFLFHVGSAQTLDRISGPV
uniref:Uncharacterized protein n=1 Tax=Kalanchoe fedtschenkoi TaxID=63787 RepID=A0A7N0VA03_KALFE